MFSEFVGLVSVKKVLEVEVFTHFHIGYYWRFLGDFTELRFLVSPVLTRRVSQRKSDEKQYIANILVYTLKVCASICVAFRTTNYTSISERSARFEQTLSAE